MSPWHVIVHAYLRSRRQLLVPGTTAGYYRWLLNSLAGYLADNQVAPDRPAPEIGAIISDWSAGRRWAASTRCTNLSIIRPFLDWAARHGHVAPGIAAELESPRRPDPLPRALSTTQVAALLTHVPDRRGHVIVLLEFQCGLRRAEVARLDVRDVDLAGGTAVVQGKGGAQRVVYLSGATLDAVRLWLVERGAAPGPLVCSLSHPGRRLTPSWIGTLVSGWMTDAGLKAFPGDGVSGHALRHSCATAMLRDGQNIRVVQRAMGHRNIQTTARYLRADDAEVRAAMTRVAAGRRLRAVEEA